LVKTFVAGAIINTDDNMHVETVAPREAFRPTMDENAIWIESLKQVLVNPTSEADQDKRGEKAFALRADYVPVPPATHVPQQIKPAQQVP
jgi:hypothetical protein